MFKEKNLLIKLSEFIIGDGRQKIINFILLKGKHLLYQRKI